MKEHDLGKDYLAPGPAYRAVPSRETLPGSEIDPYQLSKVQVSLTGLLMCLLLLPVTVAGCLS